MVAASRGCATRNAGRLPGATGNPCRRRCHFALHTVMGAFSKLSPGGSRASRRLELERLAQGGLECLEQFLPRLLLAVDCRDRLDPADLPGPDRLIVAVLIWVTPPSFLGIFGRCKSEPQLEGLGPGHEPTQQGRALPPPCRAVKFGKISSRPASRRTRGCRRNRGRSGTPGPWTRGPAG